MKRYLLLFLFFLFNLEPLLGNTHPLSRPFVETAEKAISSTVLIQADKRWGSGFIYEENGFLLTLYHQVKNAQTIQVRLPSGIWLPAELLAGDLETDVALLKVEAEGLEALEFEEAFQIGEWVLGAGIPFFNEVAIKKGIVSNTQKTTSELYLLVDFAFNPGDFGGPLLNLEGKVIGMQFANTTTHEVFGVIIPSSTLARLLSEWQRL